MERSKAVKQLLKIKTYISKRRLAADGWNEKWQMLIAILLSARTLDKTTIKVCEKLFKKFPSPENLSKATFKEIQKIIKPVNFYKNKSKYIKECCKQLKHYNYVPPLDLQKLIQLKGVGRKTANVYLSENGVPAIGVDTHVLRISNKLNWTNKKNPDKIESDLKKLFPKSKWNCINYVLVNFGQSFKKEEDLILDKIKKIK